MEGFQFQIIQRVVFSLQCYHLFQLPLLPLPICIERIGSFEFPTNQLSLSAKQRRQGYPMVGLSDTRQLKFQCRPSPSLPTDCSIRILEVERNNYLVLDNLPRTWGLDNTCLVVQETPTDSPGSPSGRAIYPARFQQQRRTGPPVCCGDSRNPAPEIPSEIGDQNIPPRSMRISSETDPLRRSATGSLGADHPPAWHKHRTRPNLNADTQPPSPAQARHENTGTLPEPPTHGSSHKSCRQHPCAAGNW